MKQNKNEQEHLESNVQAFAIGSEHRITFYKN